MESARRTLSRTERCRQAGTSGGDAFEEIAAEVRVSFTAVGLELLRHALPARPSARHRQSAVTKRS